MSPGPLPHPLARLLAVGFRRLIDGLHVSLRERGWDDVRPAFGPVLLAVRDTSTSTTALAQQMGMTKQAASKLIDAMVAAGYVQRGNDADDARHRPVILTPRGRELLAVVEEIYADLELEWAAAVGREEVEHLRSVLTRVLGLESGDLPPVRLW